MVTLPTSAATQEALLNQQILLLIVFCQVFRKLSFRLPWQDLSRHQKRRLDNAFRRLASDIELARLALGLRRAGTTKATARQKQ